MCSNSVQQICHPICFYTNYKQFQYRINNNISNKSMNFENNNIICVEKRVT